MGFQAKLAAVGGDLWRSWRMLALWPWPAVIYGRHRGLVDAEDYRCFTRLLQAGDLLLMRSEPYFLSNHFICRNGTAFSHLGVYTGPVAGFLSRDTGIIAKPRSLPVDDEALITGQFRRTVTHAVSEGVVCQDLLDVFLHADWIVAVRPWRQAEEAATIRETALAQVGLEYNFDFTPEGPKAFYCTELGVFCLEKACIKPPEKTEIPVSLSGRKFPATLADSFLAYTPVCCSVSCGDPAFARQSRFEGTREALLNAPDAAQAVEAARPPAGLRRMLQGDDNA
jgi:hypothetical protein